MLPLLVAGAALLTACREEPRVRIGGRTGTEGTLLCEIAAQLVEKRLGKPVTRFFNLGDAQQAHQALLNGEVDAYPEYAADALGSILKVGFSADPAVASENVRLEYERRFHLLWLPPLGFDNRTVMVVRSSDARRLRAATLSAAENAPDGWALAATREFTVSGWGLPLLSKHYRLEFSKPTALLPPAEIYRALRDGRATLAAGLATDAALAGGEFQPLEDDRGAFVANPAAFVLSPGGDLTHPGLRKALEALSGKLAVGRMRELNRAVEVERKPAQEVAAAFLSSAGL